MLKDFLVRFLATGLYTGYIRPFPGTWGTIPAWLFAWLLLRDDSTGLMIAAVVVFFLSVWLATAGERLFGHDARKIVIDEWAGMLIALLFVPPVLLYYVLAFVAFRVFDVVKVFPARQFERLPAGWGVTMDDVAAGIQANLLVQIMIYLMRDSL